MRKLYIFGGLILLFILLFGISSNSSNNKKTTVVLYKNYVALGDSVSAGVGLMNYSDSSACDRTNQSYPNIVALKLNLNLKNLSCSGATIDQGVAGQQDVNKLILKSQLDQLYLLPKPDLISLTIGANDIGWTDIISKCYEGSCGSSDDSAVVEAKINQLSYNLSSVLSSIQKKYSSSIPKVVVTGYHQVFPVTYSSCADLTGINSNGLSWGRQQQELLNNAISSTVSEFSFAKFAPVNFSGHELCSANPWVQGLSESAPYHPNYSGQQEYASQVIGAYREYK